MTQRVAMLPSPTTDLFEQVLLPDNLNAAWKRVRANKGAPGIDGLSTKDFTKHVKTIGHTLIEEIRQERYLPYPIKRVYIEKEGGGLRGLGIPTVFDRVIQQAILQVIAPLFEATFLNRVLVFERDVRNTKQSNRFRNTLPRGIGLPSMWIYPSFSTESIMIY